MQITYKQELLRKLVHLSSIWMVFVMYCAGRVPAFFFFAILAILNKSDEGCGLTAEDEALLTEVSDQKIPLSAKTGAGMDGLRSAVAKIAGTDRLNPAEDAILWDARQMASLSRAQAYLTEAREGLTAGDALDAVCTVCEAALSEIAGVDGRAVDDAIIDGIFARFCVGK